MEDLFSLTIPLVAIASIFIGLPWIIFHYVTQWKKSGTLSIEDERLLDELHDLARRLDDRMGTIERIVAADHPDWRPTSASERLAEERRASFEYQPERKAAADRLR